MGARRMTVKVHKAGHTACPTAVVARVHLELNGGPGDGDWACFTRKALPRSTEEVVHQGHIYRHQDGELAWQGKA